MNGFVLSILNVDRSSKTADFAVKFEPNTNTLIHRHLATTRTFVLEGDNVIFETDGILRQARPVGRHTLSYVTGDVHSEGGGPNGCTLLYSIGGGGDELFELFDGDMNSVGVIKVDDFQRLMDG